MEETNLQALCSRELRERPEESVLCTQDDCWVEGMDEKCPPGYFVLMPKTRPKKRGGKARPVAGLQVFGPFNNPFAARFIDTSARALGLLGPDPFG